MYYLQPNQRRFLTTINPLFVLTYVVLLILVRTTAEPIMPAPFRRWDILLPVAVYLGQRRSVLEGFCLILIASHRFALDSAAPIGVFGVYYVVLFLLARLLSYVIYADTWASVVVLLFSFGVASRFILTLIVSFFGQGWPVFSWGNLSISSMFLNPVIGVLIYWCLKLIDHLSFKALPSNIEMNER